MRKWLSEKLFFWAYKLDRDETIGNARLLIMLSEIVANTLTAKPKRRGRPKKSIVQPAPKKRGRPFGSKNKPKGPVA